MIENEFSRITPEIEKLSALCSEHFHIDPALYSKYDVKRGLRDVNGKGVLVGLTQISEVCATKKDGDQIIPADGELFYRGYNVRDIIAGIAPDSHFGFEESAFLLIFGKLPTKKELTDFTGQLSLSATLS